LPRARGLVVAIGGDKEFRGSHVARGKEHRGDEREVKRSHG
jgi:hypothetical protein